MELDALSAKFVQQRYSDTAFVIFQQEQKHTKQNLKKPAFDSVHSSGHTSQSVSQASSESDALSKPKTTQSSVCIVL